VTIFRMFLLASFLIGLAAGASAHGTGEHILGIVTAIEATRVDISTPKGATVTIQLTDRTQYRAKGKPGSPSLPQVGDRVVIETIKTGEILTATEIQFTSAKPAPK
jgi:hypothetical protein